VRMHGEPRIKFIRLHILSLSYPACKAHAPYYVALWPVWLHHIFPHYLISDTIFGKKFFIEHKMYVLIVCTNLCETFLILRRIQRDTIKSVNRSSCKVPAILVRL
jgi:hypothetical protein